MEEVTRKTQSVITDHIDNGKQVWSDELVEGFGDVLGQKSDDVIRIGFQNLNRIKGKISASH